MSWPQGYSASGRIMSMNNSIDTRDLPDIVVQCLNQLRQSVTPDNR